MNEPTDSKLTEFNNELRLLLDEEFNAERTRDYLKTAPPCVPGYSGFINCIPLFNILKKIENDAEQDAVFNFLLHVYKSVKDRDRCADSLWSVDSVKELPNDLIDCNFYDTTEKMKKLILKLQNRKDNFSDNDEFAFLFIINPQKSMRSALKEIVLHPQWKYFFHFKIYVSNFAFLNKIHPRINKRVKVETFINAFKEIAFEYTEDGIITDSLTDILFLSTLGIKDSPLLKPSEVLAIAGELINNESPQYMSSIASLFNNLQEPFEWNITVNNYNNPYNFVPVLLKKLGKQHKRQDNKRIMEWLDILAEGFRYQNLEIKCTAAMRITGGQENWAFRIAAFHSLGLVKTTFEIPKSMYETLTETEKQNYTCIFQDEEVNFETYLDHFVELMLIARIVPDELIRGVPTRYKFENYFLNIIPKVAYKKIKEVEEYFVIEISKLFTNNLCNLYSVLCNNSDSTSYEAFTGVSMKESLDLRRVLVLADIFLEHLWEYEEFNGQKVSLKHIENDNLGKLLLEGFHCEVGEILSTWKRKIVASGCRQSLQAHSHNDHRKNENDILLCNDIAYLTILHSANRLMSTCINIYNNAHGMHRWLKSTIQKLDEFIRKNEVISNYLREKVTANN